VRILLVNYRYFVSGGPERYMFNIKRILEENGHQVFPFSIHSNMNVETEYEKYFVNPIGGMNSVYFDEVKKTPKNILKLLSRSIYSIEVKKAIKKEIKELKPDIVYIIHFVNKLSPSVITGAKELGIPVVLRLSDYFLLCPRFDFLRDGKVCEECLEKGYQSCLKYKCVKNSFFASSIRTFSMCFHRFIKIYDKVDAFISPSNFLKDKLISSGFANEKIHVIPTFTLGNSDSCDITCGDYGLYFGRIVREKGIETAIKAYEKLPDHKLVIMGDDNTGEAIQLKKYIEEKGLINIHFIGKKNGDELEKVISNSRFVMIPSIWYDNLPNTALESFFYSKPVLASRIGSLPELVHDGENGFLFEAGNHDDLMQKIKILDDDELVLRLGKNSKKLLKQGFSENMHYQNLISLFQRYVKS
jgi:glycosyltransferase involved in cell wall biosynthesis